MAKQSFVTGQVLTAAQLTSLQQTAMSGGAASAKTANYVLVAADAGTAISMTSTSATTITVNTGLFAAGDTVFIQNLGSATCTITAGTATVNTAGSLILPQYDAGILYFVSSSSAVFYDYIQTGATSPLTTKGDLYGFGTSDARIPIGANNTVLTADSSETLGVKWAAASGGASFVGASAIASTNQVISTSTFTAILFDGTDQFDTDAFHNPASNSSRMTIPAGKAGKYAFYGRVNLDTPNSTGRRILELHKNGTAVDNLQIEVAPIQDQTILTAGIVNLSVSDYIEIFLYQTSGVSLTLYGGYCGFQIQYLGA
jgi:hypothetical protein